MADLRILQDADTGEQFYPYTYEEAVVDKNGKPALESIKGDLSEMKAEIYENYGGSERVIVHYNSRELPNPDGTFYTDTNSNQAWFGSGFVEIPSSVKSISYKGIFFNDTTITPIAIYDAEKNFIVCSNAHGNFEFFEGVIEVPDNAKYFYQSWYYMADETHTERIGENYTIFNHEKKYDFEALKNEIVGSKRIFCFGDSLTAGVITGTTTITENYPYWLKKFLKNENAVIRNFGVPGATVIDMYNTISNLVFSECDIAILMIGANGFVNDDSKKNYYRACIESIINDSKGKAKIILVNPPKSYREAVPQRWLDEMHYNIQLIANEYGLDCIDLYNYLPFDVDNDKYYSSDKVHFTKDGYYYIAFIIYNYLVNNMTASQKGGSPTFDY